MYPAECLPSQSIEGLKLELIKVFFLVLNQFAPSADVHTSLLQMRGKLFLSFGFHPPINLNESKKTRAPAPSRGESSPQQAILVHL